MKRMRNQFTMHLGEWQGWIGSAGYPTLQHYFQPRERQAVCGAKPPRGVRSRTNIGSGICIKCYDWLQQIQIPFIVKPKKKKETKKTKHSILAKLRRQHNPDLYRSFHGTSPRRVVRLTMEMPDKGEKLIKIGRLRRIEYECEEPSNLAGTVFYHDAGDTGSKMVPSNIILATNQKGTQLYLLKEKKGRWPYFSSAGIIG